MINKLIAITSLLGIQALFKCVSINTGFSNFSLPAEYKKYNCARKPGSEAQYVTCHKDYLTEHYQTRINLLGANNKQEGDSSENLLQHASKALSIGNYKKAAGIASKILSSKPEEPYRSDAVKILYESLIKEKRYEDAYVVQRYYK